MKVIKNDQEIVTQTKRYEKEDVLSKNPETAHFQISLHLFFLLISGIASDREVIKQWEKVSQNAQKAKIQIPEKVRTVFKENRPEVFKKVIH